MNEADVCRKYILSKIEAAGWEDEYVTEQLPLTQAKVNALQELSALMASILDTAFKGGL